MNIITAIPIAKGITIDYLSYFTTETVSTGSLIKVPVRNRNIYALAVSCQDATSLKSEIRQADFALRKIEKIPGRQCLSPHFIQAVFKLADYYATTPGSVLHSSIPQAILDSIEKTKEIEITTHKKKSPEKLILQTDDESRISAYRSLIREEFAKKSSVFMCVPTIEDALYLEEELSKGVEKYTFVLGSFLSKEKTIRAWNTVIEEKHPVFIIATGQFLSVPRNDIGLFIIEKESSPFYKTLKRPFLNIKKVAEEVAEAYGSRILFGDTITSIETMWRHNQGVISEISPVKLRSIRKAKHILIDRKISLEEKHDETRKESLKKGLSEEALNLITHSRENNERVFVFCNKKGLSSSVYCGDCGLQVTCRQCMAPVSLHERNNSNRFICYKCGTSRDAGERCTRCDSWNLSSYGFGIEKIRREIETHFPSNTIIQIDSETIKTRKKALDAIQSFYNTPGSILLGTDMALHYLHQPFENSIITSIDYMFGMPDFKIHERALGTLHSISSLSQKFCLIQTRIINQPLFSYIQSGNISDFYREETAERKKWGYPPFSVFIKISISGDKKSNELLLEPIQKLVSPYESDIFTSLFSDTKGKSVTNLLMRIPQEKWPDARIVEIIKNIPPHITVKVDPEHIL
ncbi:MAG: primosomal protein [Candidatus Parcubacteria bacterium]|jgi:primosomal protein N' (replication factor Y)